MKNTDLLATRKIQLAALKAADVRNAALIAEYEIEVSQLEALDGPLAI